VSELVMSSSMTRIDQGFDCDDSRLAVNRLPGVIDSFQAGMVVFESTDVSDADEFPSQKAHCGSGAASVPVPRSHGSPLGFVGAMSARMQRTFHRVVGSGVYVPFVHRVHVGQMPHIPVVPPRPPTAPPAPPRAPSPPIPFPATPVPPVPPAPPRAPPSPATPVVPAAPPT